MASVRNLWQGLTARTGKSSYHISNLSTLFPPKAILHHIIPSLVKTHLLAPLTRRGSEFSLEFSHLQAEQPKLSQPFAPFSR